MPEFKMDRAEPVYIAGHRGLVGSAVHRRFRAAGYTNLIGRTSRQLDLRNRAEVFDFFAHRKPKVVVLAAAKVGGILANKTRPHDFISENLQIQVNVLDAALKQRVPRLMFLGSSCIYPKFSKQPIKEESLLTGTLEPTNDAYAVAKIAGILQIQAIRRQYSLPWISAMPTNLYGPGDNFSLEDSHVLPAMIRRFDEARRERTNFVTNWGTGRVRREFLHVDDLASAVLHLLETFDGPQQVNVGTGSDITIRALSDIVAQATGYEGAVRWDTSKPDGTPRKLLDVSTLFASGWRPAIELPDGIDNTVGWYRSHLQELRT